ncbi:hypothetical protein RHGRI_004590 [Rhododendron griersonianum]|uniref:TOG domain-containing protein n=1 Tax=Rhododendron griersonianum TaxID=479676 RepID=A0AAV6LBA0_9ERIC|nr:hypothetical protein RHGRI_004590 [Rhododendron griersonianum]
MSTEDEKLLKEAKKLPWEDRLTHKNWKVRNDANVDLAALCDSISDPKDPRLREFGSFFRKTVADSNAPVQEKALDALISFLKAADADVGRYAKEVCDAIIAKCLTGRPKTVEKSQMIFMLWIELEAVDAFLDAMEKAIKNKVAKAVVPAIDVMFQALSEFGAKIVPPKRILKMLPELFDHQDQNVRASSKGLTLELCRWIGKEPVKSILFEKMRDTMKKELEAELVNVSGTARPSRKIRSEQDKEPEQEAVPEVVGSGPSEESVADVGEVYSLSFKETGFGFQCLLLLMYVKIVASDDWTGYMGCLSAPQEIDEYELVDPVDILTPLEKTGFWEGVKAAKWSERKEAVAELTKLASTKRIAPGCLVVAWWLSNDGSVDSIVEWCYGGGVAATMVVVGDGIGNSSFVVAVLAAAGQSGVIEMVCLNDGTPEVRDAAFSALAAVAKLVGMRPLEKSLEKLDDVRKKKLSEMIGSSGTGPVGTSSAITSAGSSSAAEASEGSFVRRSAASMLSGKKPVQSAPASKKGAAAKAGVSKKVDAAGQLKTSKLVEAEDVEPADMSLEEIESRLGSLIHADTISQLKSAVWKERLEAITSFKEQVEGTQELDQSVEILIRLLCAVPGWNEKNVQVQQQVIEVITHIGSTASKFPKKCVVLCLVGISERVADIKTRTQAMKCLTIFSEAVGPGFVFERLYKIMKEHKNPKVLSEGILWMVSAVEDFGVSHLKLKDLIDFCKDTGLQSSAAATRNATIKLIGALHKYIGPDIKGFLSDVKPALLSAVEAECEKNPFEGSVAPKKTVKVLESTSSLSGGGLDSLPREDISGKITPTLLKGLESPDWKVRLESIEAVNKILEEANKRIQPTGTVELFGALRGRLNDSNKNLVTQTLCTVGAVAFAMGPAVEKSSKGILSDVLKCLGDNKKNMRESTLVTLDAWLAAVHLDKMVPYITTALTDAKLGAEGRKDLFDWVSKQLTGLTDFADAVHLLKPTASAMTDKSADVRKAAEVCLGDVLRVCGHESVTKNLRDIQGPALAIVLERLRPNGAFHETISTGPAAKSGSKVAKSSSNGHGDRIQKHGSKAVSSRGISTKGSRAESIMSIQDITVQSQALLNVRESNKDERERLVVRRFKFEEPRLEQIQDLENDLMKYFREDLHRRLLSTDFKKQVDGIEMLHKALPSIGKEIIEVLDILLRWFVLRFCESNTSCLLKVLEFLPELFDMLRIEGYTLTESEAAIFLPCLIEKSGHNIEKVREKMRELAKQVIHSYSAAKTFPYFLEGLRSRNNRTRIESVDLVGFLIDSHGAEVSGQLKSLQVVASLTAERDGEIRKAALNTLATGYKILGDDIWRYVGKLTDAQRSMLDDRFKWKAREMDKRKEGKPGEARAVLRRSVRENGSEVAEQSGDVSRSVSGPIFTRDQNSELHMERASIPRAIATADGPMDWNEALDIIQDGSPEQSVEGMKFICNVLVQATSNPEDSAMDDIVKDADRLVSCLANKVAKTFDFSIAGASSRSCKYVLNTLMQTFQNKRLADAVKESTLNSLVTELLLWLLDERVPRMDDGGQLLKALNVLMLKILDNAERTSSFVVLINLLRPLDPSRWPSSETKESLADRNTKFSDLVVKCLIKLTKVLQSTIYEVDLDRILQSIHIYLEDLGMEEIRRRAGADDKPLRMVKTVLHELVKLRGTAIKGHLSMVPIDMEPQPIILAYIDLNLQTLAAARMLTPSGPVGGQTHWRDSAANNPPPTNTSADAQLKVDIFSQLQNASEAFRTYIRDGLVQMEKNEAAGRTPSSLPLSTPPPAAMNLSSPKFGPLSPVNANVLNDTRSQNTKVEPSNFMAGVTSGTLDAIRERMKSIQLAAAAGNPDSGNRPLMNINGNIAHSLSNFHTSDRANPDNPGQSGVLPMDEKALSGLQARMERLKSGSIEPL